MTKRGAGGKGLTGYSNISEVNILTRYSNISEVNIKKVNIPIIENIPVAEVVNIPSVENIPVAEVVNPGEEIRYV